MLQKSDTVYLTFLGNTEKSDTLYLTLQKKSDTIAKKSDTIEKSQTQLCQSFLKSAEKSDSIVSDFSEKC